ANPAAVTYTPAVNFSGTVTLTLTSDAPAGCTPVTDTRTITVNQAPTVNAGTPQTICSNGTATLSATLGGGATSGTWTTSGSGTFSDNSPTATYTPSAGDINSGSATLTYTTNDPDGAGPCVAASSTVAITINKAPVITSQPANTAVCAGFPASLTVVASGDGLTYQWYKGPAGSGTAISGATSATLSFAQATLTDNGSYYVIVSGVAPCAPVTSAVRTLNVDQAINITAQPVTITQCAGTNATFSVTAEANGATLTYQWRKGGVDIPGATSPTLTINNIAAGDAGNYDVVISGATGYTCSSIISNPAALTVTPHSTITLSSAGGTDAQTTCINTAITNITYTIGGGGTGATVSSLPSGLTGSFSNGVFT
ncbi:MAG TPA: immunoglobulin domain-containing protein, partial [Gammaproteobacteria bacterium]|nr:immunoglobulin domain-containing protein [Gammaproteobacteria bacterium]